MIRKALIFCLVVSLFSFPSQATDEKAREKAALLREIKCPTCQGQSVSDSNADAAREIKSYIEEEFKKGTPVTVIKETLVGRYGESVLFEPPVTLNTILLWGGPFFLFGIFLSVAALKAFRQKREIKGHKKAP